jgi:hypothetical protein
VCRENGRICGQVGLESIELQFGPRPTKLHSSHYCIASVKFDIMHPDYTRGERKAKKKIRQFRVTSVITFLAFGNQKIPSLQIATTLTMLLIAFFRPAARPNLVEGSLSKRECPVLAWGWLGRGSCRLGDANAQRLPHALALPDRSPPTRSLPRLPFPVTQSRKLLHAHPPYRCATTVGHPAIDTELSARLSSTAAAECS